MKITCHVCRDLLLLYEEDICSEESRKLVDAHLKGCADCQSYLRQMRMPQEMVMGEPLPQALEEKKTLQRSFHKIRLRWRISLIALLMVIPLIGLGYLTVNEIRGEGICYTNLDDIWLNWYFYHLLQKGKYKQAADMIDFERNYNSIMGDWDYIVSRGEEGFFYEIYGDLPNMTPEEFEEQERQKMVDYWEENGLSIKEVDFYGWNTYRYPGGEWCIAFKVVENTTLPELPEITYTCYFGVNDGELSYSSRSTNLDQLQQYGMDLVNLDFSAELEWVEIIREASHLSGAFEYQSNRLSSRINGLE